MRVLVAPDKFKGTLTAVQAARAIATGWLRVRPDDELDEVPMADGGDGTLDTLLEALGGERYRVTVSGPLGDPVEAEYGIAHGDDGPIGVVEMARASGLLLLSEDRYNPRRTTTRGTGELILAACAHRPSSVIVCIGGSATNDGGAGMAQAIGARLLDQAGREIAPGGEHLLGLASVDVSGIDRSVRETRFVVACDVDNPLTGPSGAAAVFGPQKGATPDDVALLDRALGHYAAVLHRDLGIDIRTIPGAGAAGGLGGGMVAFCGAKLRPGIRIVMDAVRLPERARAADAVITGEGTFDAQSLHGKTTKGIIDTAREAGVPVAVLAGRAEVGIDGVETRSLVETFGEERALHETRPALEELSQRLAGSWPV